MHDAYRIFVDIAKKEDKNHMSSLAQRLATTNSHNVATVVGLQYGHDT